MIDFFNPTKNSMRLITHVGKKNAELGLGRRGGAEVNFINVHSKVVLLSLVKLILKKRLYSLNSIYWEKKISNASCFRRTVSPLGEKNNM